MGVFLKGQWQADKYEMHLRAEGIEMDSVNHWITADGSAGPTGKAGFKAEANRYHLYACKACPFAQRVLIMLHLKGLSDVISVSYVETVRDDSLGWSLAEGADPVNQLRFLKDLFQNSLDDYTGRVVVPLLWDKQSQQIVSGESSDIIKMLDQSFDTIGASTEKYYPEALRSDIDELSEFIEKRINYAVYGVGFSFDQESYSQNIQALFSALDEMEARLQDSDHLLGKQLTLADIRLLCSLLRFDSVYHYHFKCNLKRIEDYPALSNYLQRLYRLDAVRDTTDIELTKVHYFKTHKMLNPLGIVPAGPSLSFIE